MVADKREALRQWLCSLRENPSGPYREAVYHSSLQYCKGRPWPVLAKQNTIYKRNIPFQTIAKARGTREASISSGSSSFGSVSSASSEHLELPGQLSTTLAPTPAVQKRRKSQSSSGSGQSKASTKSPMSRSPAESARQSVEDTERDDRSPGSVKAERSLSAASSHSSASSRGKASKEGGSVSVSPPRFPESPSSEPGRSQRSASPIAQYISASSESTTSTVIDIQDVPEIEMEQCSSSVSTANIEQLQQNISDIREDNRTLTANMQNLRELLFQQTEKLKEKENQRKGGLEEQISDLRQSLDKQGGNLENLQARSVEIEKLFDGRITALEEKVKSIEQQPST